jgi:MFS transporter, PPP family, 3-phenylpropionic acid transporter
VVATSGIAYALYFGAVGAWAPHVPVYYQNLGVGLAAIGVLTAIPAAVQIFGAPSWGMLADRLGDVRAPLVLAMALAVAVAVVLALRPPVVLLFPGVGLLAAGTCAVAPLVDARTVQDLGAQRGRYGQARALGSVGFILAAVGVGALIDAAGDGAMFATYIPLLAGTALVVALLFGRPGRGQRVKGIGPLRALALLRTRTFGLFFASSVLVWTAFGGASAYFSVRLVEQGADASLVGIGWAVNALVEVPAMLVFRRLADRTGVPALMVAGALALGIRNLGWGLAGSATASVGVAALSGVGFSLFLVGTTTWLAELVPSSMRATAQALFLGTAYAIGSIAGSLGAGLVAQAAGVATMFDVMAGVGLVAAAATWVALRAARAEHGG